MLKLIRKARTVKDPKARAEFISDARRELKYVDANKHPELFRLIDAQIRGLAGGGAPTGKAAGRPGNRINPKTRVPEFADWQTYETDAGRWEFNPAVPNYTFTGIPPDQSLLQIPDNVPNVEVKLDPFKPNPSNSIFTSTGLPPANWSNPLDPYGLSRRTTPPGRSPFGRMAFVGSEDEYFADNLRRQFEGLTQADIEAKYGNPNADPNSSQTNSTIETLKELMREKEGFREKCELDSVNGRTVVCGYGHDLGDSADAKSKIGFQYTKDELEAFLDQDARSKFLAASKLVKPEVWESMGESGQIAFTSLVLNVGEGAVGKSEALRYLNEGDFLQAGREWLEFNKVRLPDNSLKYNQGLMNRRLWEVQLLLGSSFKEVQLPSDYVAPNLPTSPTN